MTSAGPAATDQRRLSRAAYGLSGAAVVATLFALAPSSDAVRFVNVPLPVVAVLLVVAALGLLGARSGRPLFLAGAAGIGMAASALQLVELAVGADWLGGNGSTSSFLAALGIGFGALWYAGRPEAATDPDTTAGPERSAGQR